MEDYQTYCKQSPNVWPSVAGVELIYKLTPEGSLFRKFAAHSVSCKPPSEQHEERSEERKDWNDLFDRCPELSKDMARMGKSWNGTLAWDEVHRVEYMVDEAPVDERWEAMILNARSREEIERAAENGCRRSKIELEHLDRAEYEDHGGVDMK
jgi:hypothetical protein